MSLPASTLPALPHVGVTATRHGLSPIQQAVARIVLLDLRDRRGAHTLHDGMCVGGDAFLAHEARRRGYRTVGHPGFSARNPGDLSLRDRGPRDEVRMPLHHLVRDTRIVVETSVLLGFPGTEQEVYRGSGTWYTVREARRLDRPRLVITPSGRCVESVGVEGLFTAMPAGEAS